MASAVIKTVAEDIIGQNAAKDLEKEINQLVALVADPNEDINIRIELAGGFRFFSGTGLAVAVRQLIDDIRRTGVGAYYLSTLEELC